MHYLCHYCNKSTFHQFYVKCCKKKCSKLFCLDCILLKFDKTFKPENVRPQTWICYACGQKCDCIYCDPKGQKRVVNQSNPQTSSKLPRMRVYGKIKWYHEKNRGALKTVSFDCVKQAEMNNLQEKPGIITLEKDDDVDSCASFEQDVKLEKRKEKRDLSKIENKYLNKKKALRECSEHEIVEDIEENKHEKIAKLLNSIDFDGSKKEIIVFNYFFIFQPM